MNDLISKKLKPQIRKNNEHYEYDQEESLKDTIQDEHCYKSIQSSTNNDLLMVQHCDQRIEYKYSIDTKNLLIQKHLFQNYNFPNKGSNISGSGEFVFSENNETNVSGNKRC